MWILLKFSGRFKCYVTKSNDSHILTPSTMGETALKCIGVIIAVCNFKTARWNFYKLIQNIVDVLINKCCNFFVNPSIACEAVDVWIQGGILTENVSTRLLKIFHILTGFANLIITHEVLISDHNEIWYVCRYWIGVMLFEISTKLIMMKQLFR